MDIYHQTYKSSKLASISCIFFIFSYLFGQALALNYLLAISLIFGYSSFLISSRLNFHGFFILLTFSTILSTVLFFNNSYEFSRLIFSLLFLMLGFLLATELFHKRINGVYILRIFITIFFSMLFLVYIISLFKGIPLYEFLESLLVGFSYNYISGLLIFSVVAYLALLKTESISHNNLLPLVVLMVFFCYILYGRSGIIFSLLTFFVYILSSFNFKKGLYIYSIIVAALLFFVFLFQHYESLKELVLSSKFKEGFKSPRILMLQEYFLNLNTFNLLMGVDLKELPTVVQFNMNPHNSYINLHALMGFFGLMIIISLIFMTIFITVFDFWLGCYIWIYFGRGFLDIIILPGLFDFVFIYVIFYNFLRVFQKKTTTSF